MKHLLYLFLLGITLQQYGCGGVTCVTGELATETRTWQLADIRGVQNNLSATVVLIESNDNTVTVTGPADVLELLDFTIVDGNICQVGANRCIDISEELTIEVRLPGVEEVRLFGSGDIRTQGVFAAANTPLTVNSRGSGNVALEVPTTGMVDAELNGSGSITLDVGMGSSAKVALSGSGELTLKGAGPELNGTLNGAGDLQAADFSADEVDLRNSGAGDAYLRPINDLNVQIAGSGSVYYYGSPNLTQSITGTGELVQLQ